MTEYERFAVELAREAARVTLPFFRGDYAQDNKASGGAFDPVTEADRAAEAAIRRLIETRYPEHGVIGEEYGEDRPDADHVWVLDPIDGTRAFICGLPLWTTLIALRTEGKPRVGVIAQPYLDEIFLGGPSGAVLLKGEQATPLQTRACDAMDTAVLSTTDPAIFNETARAAFDQVRKAVQLTRLGCDAYAYAMVAAGRMDMVIESELKVWDWSALTPVIEAAGGIVTDWRGDAPSNSGQVLALGDRRLAEPVLSVLKTAAI